MARVGLTAEWLAHPDAQTHRRRGERFAKVTFAGNGVFSAP